MNPKKDAGRAMLLSCFIPGLGQVYNGQYGKALFFFITWVIVLLWPIAIIDAWESANKINNEAYAEQLGLTKKASPKTA